jgi:carboxyl-terminal processing protease
MGLIFAMSFFSGPARAGEGVLLDESDITAAIEIIRKNYYEDVTQGSLLQSYLQGVEEYSRREKTANPLTGVKLPGSMAMAEKILGRAMKNASIKPEKAQPYIRAGIAAMVAGLENPGCKYHAPGEYRQSLKESGYSHGGCGFLVSETPDAEGYFTIIETLQNFPAEKEGVQPGDRIAQVGGRPVKGLTFYNLADLVRGPIGSNVTVMVIREGKYLVIPIKRTWLGPNPNSLSSAVLPGGIGYVKFRFLGDLILFGLSDIYRHFEKEKVQAVIWDLRNSSGTMQGGLDLASLYAPKGSPFIARVFREDQETISGKDQPVSRLPLVAIINRNTDSPCAALALVLKKFGWAETVGTPARWESELKQTFWLRDGSALTISQGYYQFPDGTTLKNGDRIEPGVTVEQKDVPPYGDGGDAQLEKAKEILKEKIH